ncbi:MAG: tRNA modification GTPase [Phycisphaerae bacterium]|nr:tRNA modification GTPase [Phycisphaerae bacterium]
MYFSIDDTIVALSSAMGSSARGIVRLSGPDAFALTEQFFTSASSQPDFSKKTSHLRLRGQIKLTDQQSCPGQLYIFREPNSYTGQNLAELHLPGSPALLRMIIEKLLAVGARQANPGEFTARAFFNGRMDLSEAEAVGELVTARSDAQLRGAKRLLDGALRKRCAAITAEIADLLALIEADIDFSDQEIDLVNWPDVRGKITAVEDDLELLLKNSLSWEQLEHLPQVVLAGPANAGKSCLTNALLEMDRSIVDSMAGTTRDLLSGPLHLEHGECLLIDTAGLGPVSDLLAAESQELTRQAMMNCDLLIWIIDAADQRSAEMVAADLKLLAEIAVDAQYGTRAAVKKNFLIVANKIDRCGKIPMRLKLISQLSIAQGLSDQGKVIGISAPRGDNLGVLKRMIEDILHGAIVDSPGEVLALTVRQRLEMEAAADCVKKALELLSEHQTKPAELVALELRAGLDHLGAISGEVVTEEVLGRIFSRFCVGK